MKKNSPHQDLKMVIIEKTIEVNASPGKVWRVFTDPVVTRQMGGEYVTEWKAGGSLGWKGQDGNIYTDGMILQLEPGTLFKHNLLDLNDKSILLSVITYEFKENDGGTIISAREELNYEITEDQLHEASEGWDLALRSVKEIAEKL